MATRAAQADDHPVGRRRDRARAQADLADLEAGVAVQGVGHIHVVEHGGAVQGLGPARHRLLGRLEEEADPARVLGTEDLLQGQARPEEDGGVDVVAAGVTDTRHGRPVGHFLLVVQRQGVDVGSEQDRGPGPVPQVDLQAGLGGQWGDGGAGHLETGPDGGGRLVLGPRQLGVGMETTPEGDQLLAVGVEERVEGGRGGAGHRGSAMSSTSWFTTPRRSPPFWSRRRWRT